jgi:hypothetical protein
MPGMTDQVPSERRSNETGSTGDLDPHLKSFTTNRHWQPTHRIGDSLTSDSHSWVNIPPRKEFRVITNVILFLVWLIAHNEKNGIFVTKSLRGPHIRWQ